MQYVGVTTFPEKVLYAFLVFKWLPSYTIAHISEQFSHYNFIV